MGHIVYIDKLGLIVKDKFLFCDEQMDRKDRPCLYTIVAIFKTVKVNKDMLFPGYYLVKAFTENSADYLIFKKNKIAVAVAPVSSKEELPKKVKKVEYYLEEDQHGKIYVLTIKYQKQSYTAKLDILEGNYNTIK